MSNLFGSRNPRPQPSYQQQSSGSYSRVPTAGSDRYGSIPSNNGLGYEREDYAQRQPRSRRHLEDEGASHSIPPLMLRVQRAPHDNVYSNTVAVSDKDFPPPKPGYELYVMINNSWIFTAKRDGSWRQGEISLSEPQRVSFGIQATATVEAKLYNPFQEQRYLGCITADVGFANPNKTVADKFDPAHLCEAFINKFENQVLAPGQWVILQYGDIKIIPISFFIRSVQFGNLSMEKSSALSELVEDKKEHAILTRESIIKLASVSDSKHAIKLKGSTLQSAPNAILQPDFRFADMGIGGLDKEFGVIFRRAFASRVMPLAVFEQLGLQHVKGVLLYGPPGTGKTLIARKIGQMLKAREPKIVNGPEILNKFVGQSEENVRKLFAEAEKEYKEKGEESGLHIIIFDELDAVCKQRGSTGGGTGVGDSVVNQLLSKLDGVDQLNNILLIGMTNRKDMIDDALLRPGRLEVHVEISLPDENGRIQILNIHTSKMRESGKLDRDVDLNEIASLAKNYSGAEIAGLVRSASSYAFNRQIKVGTEAGVADDVGNLTVNRADFDHALNDIQPAFGVSEQAMQQCLRRGIIRFSPFIDDILEEGKLMVRLIQDSKSTSLFSALLYGPPGSGKTALAAKIALDSGYPFVRMCGPDNMSGLNEAMKIGHLLQVFDAAYKSPLSLIILDNIEDIVEWTFEGPRFSNPILQTVKVLLKKNPPEGRQLLILGTSSERSVMQRLGLYTAFDSDIAVPNVGRNRELSYLLEESGAFQNPNRAVEELQEILKGSDDVNVGIKKILVSIEKATKDDDPEGMFATLIARARAQMGILENS